MSFTLFAHSLFKFKVCCVWSNSFIHINYDQNSWFSTHRLDENVGLHTGSQGRIHYVFITAEDTALSQTRQQFCSKQLAVSFAFKWIELFRTHQWELIYTHAKNDGLTVSFLPKDASTCRQEAWGIEPATMQSVNATLYLLSHSQKVGSLALFGR